MMEYIWELGLNYGYATALVFALGAIALWAVDIVRSIVENQPPIKRDR